MMTPQNGARTRPPSLLDICDDYRNEYPNLKGWAGGAAARAFLKNKHPNLHKQWTQSGRNEEQLRMWANNWSKGNERAYARK